MTVSVIIPVYNVEQYLDECIESVINQTYKDIQIILVDDGSTDRSAAICDQYAKKDQRIISIHKKNEGVSVARNVGIEKSNGDYIVFVDSDDMVDSDFISYLLHPQYDLVVADIVRFCNENYSKRYSHMINEDKTFLDRLDLCYLYRSYNMYSASGKLFKASIIRDNHISFPPDIDWGEDSIFVANYIRCCKTIRCLPEAKYFYRTEANKNSLANKIQADSMRKVKMTRETLIDLLSPVDSSQDFKEILISDMYQNYMYQLDKWFYTKMSLNKRIHCLKEFFKMRLL